MQQLGWILSYTGQEKKKVIFSRRLRAIFAIKIILKQRATFLEEVHKDLHANEFKKTWQHALCKKTTTNFQNKMKRFIQRILLGDGIFTYPRTEKGTRVVFNFPFFACTEKNLNWGLDTVIFCHLGLISPRIRGLWEWILNGKQYVQGCVVWGQHWVVMSQVTWELRHDFQTEAILETPFCHLGEWKEDTISQFLYDILRVLSRQLT